MNSSAGGDGGGLNGGKTVTITEILPKSGLVYSEKGSLSTVLCKPKIMPIKSLAIQKQEEKVRP